MWCSEPMMALCMCNAANAVPFYRMVKYVVTPTNIFSSCSFCWLLSSFCICNFQIEWRWFFFLLTKIMLRLSSWRRSTCAVYYCIEEKRSLPGFLWNLAGSALKVNLKISVFTPTCAIPYASLACNIKTHSPGASAILSNAKDLSRLIFKCWNTCNKLYQFTVK
jgi:hypothetical protein